MASCTVEEAWDDCLQDRRGFKELGRGSDRRRGIKFHMMCSYASEHPGGHLIMRTVKRILVSGTMGLFLAACVSSDPGTAPTTTSSAPPSTSATALDNQASDVRCYSDDSLPEGSSWIIEFVDGVSEFSSLESIPATDEFGEPRTDRRLALGTLDDPSVASVRLDGLPHLLYALETWHLTSDTVRRPSLAEPGQDRIGAAIDCAEVDVEAALSVLAELKKYNQEMESQVGIVDGPPRRVATIAAVESERVEVFVDFPGANKGSMTSELNNVLATGRTIVFEGVEFSEMVAPSVSRSNSTFWIDTSFLVETKSLGDVAESGGVVLGVLDSLPSTVHLSVEGIELPIADDVVIEGGLMLSGPFADRISTIDEAIEAGLLVVDRGVELTVSADGLVVGLLIHSW